jgi:hypothetical protein
VLFEHETGDTEAVHFVAEFLHAGVSVPFMEKISNLVLRRVRDWGECEWIRCRSSRF